VSRKRVDPLTETSTEIDTRWSRDREAREIQTRQDTEKAADDYVSRPIHPRELAAKIADEMHDVAPDWRSYRPQVGLYWGQLLRAQPESDPKLTQQREALIVALLNSVPAHVRPIVSELRPLMELAFVGHECAAFAIGWEAGRLFERRQIANGAPGPTAPGSLVEPKARNTNELAAMVRRLQRLGEALGCDVEITVRPRRQTPTTLRRHPPRAHRPVKGSPHGYSWPSSASATPGRVSSLAGQRVRS